MASQWGWDHFQQEFRGIVLQGQMAKTWHQVKKYPAYGLAFLSSKGTEGVWETWVNPLRAKSRLQELQQMLCNCFSGDCSRMVGRKFREIISSHSIWILQRLPTL